MPSFSIFTACYIIFPMKVTIWVMSLSSPALNKVRDAIKTVLGSTASFRSFPAVPEVALVKDSTLPDLVIADIAKDPDGLTSLMLALRAIRPVDLAIVTGDSSPGIFTRAHQLGTIDYVLDPCSKPRLQDLTRRYLSMRFSLTGLMKVSQSDLDKLLPPIRHSFTFSDPLDQEVLTYLSSHPLGVGVAKAALDLSLSASTTRRTLETLAKKGCVKRVSSSQGAVGRPSILYILNPMP